MRISRARLRSLITEALLTELFKSTPYPYSVKEMNIVSNAHAKNVTKSGGGKVTQQDVLYEFETDPSDEDYGGEGFGYVVSFTLDMLTDPATMPWEDEQDPQDPDNYFWTIVFEADKLDGTGKGYDITQTHQGDLRVYSTIASIVKNFITIVLPKIPDRDVKTFSFVGSPTHVLDDEKGHMVPARGDSGRTRRTNIYTGMLKRKLPPGSEIIPMPAGGGHSAGSEENIIFFRVPENGKKTAK